MAKQKYYFTFGAGQKYEGGYHIIEMDGELEARAEMSRRFGHRWCGCCSSAEEAGVERLGLHEVSYKEPLPMFLAQLYANSAEVKELDAEFRNLKTARVYILECIVTLNATREEEAPGSGTILGYIFNPSGVLVWWTKSEITTKELCMLELKLGTLPPEELEHIEFVIDAFRKRRGLEEEYKST